MYALAVDIGASSGRHILGHIENGQLITEEIYRFSNGITEKNGHLCWDTDMMFKEIINGMKVAKNMGIIPDSIGIDCFGVDFVLIDDDGNRVGDSVSYRDSRTKGMRDEIRKTFSDEFLYKKTGSAGGDISSVCQLLSIKRDSKDLEHATSFLQLPDYFNFRLTGIRANELTNSERTFLLNVDSGEFDKELIEAYGLPSGIFKTPLPPTTVLGELSEDIEKEVGYSCKVILTASHDTISAMLAAPYEDSIIISSGTWSMFGVHLKNPVLTEDSQKLKLANVRIDKDSVLLFTGYTGLWIIQSIKKNLGDRYGFGELSDMARTSDYSGRIDISASEFVAPENMIDAITDYLVKNGEEGPKDICDILSCVYHSMAIKYAKTFSDFEAVTNKKYPSVTILGGGNRDEYLNELIARYSKKSVHKGATEATAIGNLLAQLCGLGEFSSIKQASRVL